MVFWLCCVPMWLAIFWCPSSSSGPPGSSLVCLSYWQNHAWDQADHITHLEAMGQPMRGMIHIASWDRITRRAQGTLLEGSRTVICRVVTTHKFHKTCYEPAIVAQDWRLCCLSASPLPPSFVALAQDTWINCAEDLRMPDCEWPVYIWTGFINMYLSGVAVGEDEHVLLNRFASQAAFLHLIWRRWIKSSPVYLCGFLQERRRWQTNQRKATTTAQNSDNAPLSSDSPPRAT